MYGTNFPVSDYYKENILDAVTISHSGTWWTAVLLIKDPKTNNPFLGLYRWQNKAGEWKVRTKFYFRTEEQITKITDVIKNFSSQLVKKSNEDDLE